MGSAIFAMGQAMGFPALMTLAVSGAPASQRGSVVATFTAFFDLSFGLGAMTLGGVADVLGYRGTFLGASVVAVAGLVMMAVRRRSAQTRDASPGSAAAAGVAPRK